MKKYLIPTLFFISIFFIGQSVLFAQTPQPKQVTAIAEVNIQGAKVSNQVGRVVNVLFALSNGKGVQSGVRYSVRLYAKDSTKAIADEKTYTEALTLAENSVTQKSVVYTAPDGLSGEYLVYVVSSNSAGFPFAIASAGTVTFTGASDAQMVPGSCVLIEKNTKVRCEALNTTKSAISVTPTLQIFKGSLFGEQVTTKTASSAALALKGGEKKTFTVNIPAELPAGQYVAEVALVVGATKSNSVSLPFVLSGAFAQILNASLDKDYYQAKGRGTLMLSWIGTDAKTAEVRIASHGVSCTKVTETLSAHSQRIGFTSSLSCSDPVVDVVLKDDQGKVLDSKTFSIKTSSINVFATQRNTLFTILAVIVAIIILGLVIRKKKVSPVGVAGIVLALALFLPLAKTHANTYQIGPNSELLLTVNINNPLNPGSTIFQQGNPLYVDGSIQNLTSVNQSASLSAITVGNSSINLFTTATINLVPLETRLANNTPGIFTVNVPTTPPLPQNFNVVFTAGLLEPIYVKIIEQGVTEYTETIDQGPICPPVVLHHRNVGSIRAEFYSDSAGTVPIDVTGMGFRLVLMEGHAYPGDLTFSNTPVLSGTYHIISPGLSYNGTLGNFLPPFTFGCGGIEIPNLSGFGVWQPIIPFESWPPGITVYYTRLPPPPAPIISANPSRAIAGDSVDITWNGGWASTCTGTGFSTGGLAYGTETVVLSSSPATYSVTCTNAVGSGSASVTVQLPFPEIEFSATPTNLISGNPVTITWSSTYTSSCTGNFATGGATSGNDTQYPTYPITYTISCTGPGGTVNASVDVQVCPTGETCQTQ